MGIWEFIQNQILGMKWLNELIGEGLSVLGLDLENQRRDTRKADTCGNTSP